MAIDNKAALPLDVDNNYDEEIALQTTHEKRYDGTSTSHTTGLSGANTSWLRS